MGYILGISGFLLLIGSTCLTGATIGQIVLTACIGLALMLAGKLWSPAKSIIKERRKRRESEKNSGGIRKNAA